MVAQKLRLDTLTRWQDTCQTIEVISLSLGLVVVVEDDPAIREVISELLLDEGYRVEAISDGSSAARRINQIHSARGPITAITLDLSLPGRDGASILRELKTNAHTRDVPVVVISASMPTLPADTRPLAAALIRKPFDAMHLLDTVSTIAAKCALSTAPYQPAALATRPPTD